VHLEADAVPERVEVPVLDDLARLLVQHRLVSLALERLAGDRVEIRPVGAGAHSLERAVERLLDEAVVFAEFGRNLADAERSRHVGEARGLGVLRPEVDHDRLARLDLARAHVVPDRRLRAVRDDELVERAAVSEKRVLDRELHALGRQLLAIDDERAVRLIGAAEEVAGGVHSGFRGALGSANPGELGLVLRAPSLVEELPVGRQLDAVVA